MPNLDLDSIARDIYNASYIDLAKEKKVSDEQNKKDTYSIESLNTFIEQFHSEFNNMYAKTLENLHISPTRNPTLSGIVKDSLLNVLAEESGRSIINPETHKLDFSNFSRESLKKARHRVKHSQSPKELENAAKEPETSSVSLSSSNTSKNTDEFQDKSKLSFDKLLDNYSSLSSSKEKFDFIKKNMIYNSNNLSKDTAEDLTYKIAEYMDYKQFVKEIREVNPDISRKKLRAMYLKKHPELDEKEFNDKIDFTKAYLALQEKRAELDSYLKDPKLVETYNLYGRMEILKAEILPLSETVNLFIEKYNLSPEIADKLCQNLDDEEPSIDTNDEELSYTELAKEAGEFIYGDSNDEPEINTFLKNTHEFVSAYTTLTELQDDYEINESPELAEQISQYEILVNDYIDKYDLSEEDIITLIKSDLSSEKDDDFLPGLEEKEIEEELDLDALDLEELEESTDSISFELDSELDEDVSYNLEDEFELNELEEEQTEVLDIESLNSTTIENEVEQNITEYEYEQNSSKPPIFQAFDDTRGSGKVFETVTNNLENAKEEQNYTSEISQNPIIKFFKDRIEKFNQKRLAAPQPEKTHVQNTMQEQQSTSSNYTEKSKENIFSRMKNAILTLANVNQSSQAAIVETHKNTSMQSNSWDLTNKERAELQENAYKLSKNIQNKSTKQTIIESDKNNTLSI